MARARTRMAGLMGLSLMLGLIACGGQGGTPAPSGEKLRVAFIYSGPIGDQGWNWAHDQGRQALQRALPDVETAYRENLAADKPAETEQALREFAQKGYKIIFSTSFGHQDSTIKIAKEFPNTVFIQMGLYDKTITSISTATGKMDEPRYVSGMLAGKMTQSNIIGYIAPVQVAAAISQINAFTLGVRKTNPTAQVKVIYIETFFDPQKERAAAEALLDAGADVITEHLDTPAAQQAAEARGKLGIGYSADMSKFAPNAVLTSVIWNWGAFYITTVKQVQAGTWKTQAAWVGWKDGMVDLAPLSARVPAEVKQMIEAEADRFRKGEATIYTIFTGPIKDPTGMEKISAGKSLTDEELGSMDWYVAGVEIAKFAP